MKHIVVRLSLLLGLLLGFASCEKVVEFKPGEVETRVVMNAYAQSDTNLVVRLTRTRFFLSDAPFETVKGAVVTLYVNGSAVGTATETAENYRFSYAPQGGDSLTLVAVADGRTVTAAARIPTKPNVSNVYADWSTATWGENYGIVDTTRYLNIHFTLNDPAEVRNYYRMKVVYEDTVVWMRADTVDAQGQFVVDTQIYEGYGRYACTDLDIDGIDGLLAMLGYGDSNMMFTDSVVNGTEHEVVVTVCQPRNGVILVTHPKVVLELEAMSYDTYRYLKTLPMDGNSMMASFSEAAQAYSNVVGGLGILGATNKFAVTVPVPPKAPSEPRSGR